ncbi:DUF1998 domain-containing protein [Desulfatitalea tepidiphila]|uniref:DUF1998 domain-containing protein n=1 Tax=Desulfatitalea tepidiphila TaxID=1185843 RepID=UPI0009F9691E|nr:DUF1998 domain-containing protein [Desulfatitalea tepidiphila]
MARKSLRRSQAVIPFGIGALVDFPGQSLMAAGLDVWPDQPECQVRDDRLARRLEVDYFRSPPPPPQPGFAGEYLPFVRFPLWHFCPRCRTMKRANWNDVSPPRCDSELLPLRTGAPSCATLPEKKRWRMVPLRFVVACENGHIDDFPWVLWAHSRPGESLDTVTPCNDPVLRFNYTGKAGLMGLLIKCEACGAKARSLMGSAGPNSLKGFKCEGNRPWLGPHGQENCISVDPPRMLQRGATNLHFSKIASSILIPPFSDPIRKLVDDAHNWSVLTSGVEEGGTPDEMRLRIFAEMKKLDFKRLKEVVTQKLAGVGLENGIQTEEEYRFSEYKAMLESPGDTDQEFITEKPEMGTYEEDIREYIDQVVLVKKLAETRVLTGFSRINPPPYREFDQQDQSQLSLQAKPWLPGIRVYGEGIFFTLKASKIQLWLSNTDTRRYDEIFANHRRIYNKLGRKPREIPSKFFLLHTLAHILIRRLSFECGYGSSSLRERIYCWEGDDRAMNGILIYTAAGDSEGTMGGLVEQGKPGRLEFLFQGALKDALWCSTDPLCIESHGQGIDSLNRAACHACALLPETSCEEGNRFLDRVAVVGKPDNLSLGFFYDIVNNILSGTEQE